MGHRDRAGTGGRRQRLTCSDSLVLIGEYGGDGGGREMISGLPGCDQPGLGACEVAWAPRHMGEVQPAPSAFPSIKN